MEKGRKRVMIVLALLSLTMLAGAVGCGSKIHDVILSSSEITLHPGETFTLTATVKGTGDVDQSVVWASQRPEIATVDANGVVTAVSLGETNITAHIPDGKIGNSCRVKVEEKISLWDGRVPSAAPAGFVTDASGDVEIGDAAAFAWFAKTVNEGNSYSGKKVVLGTGVDLGGHTWTPIGSSYRSGVTDPKVFSGSFDGGNFLIKHMTNEGYEAEGDYLFGLFGNTDGAVIKNLRMEGFEVSSTQSHADTAGGLVAYSGGEITIDNCHLLSGSIYGNSAQGGILGRAYGGVTRITNCSNAAEVRGSGKNGGIVGIVSNGGTLAEIKDCTNTGKIRDAQSSGGILGYAGGVAQFLIESCTNEGDISRADFAGGIVGYDQGDAGKTISVTSCANSGKITGGNASGGIIGLGSGVYGRNLLSCTNSGEIGDGGSDVSGGIIGSSQGASVKRCENSGSVSAADIAGGIVNSNNTSDILIESCSVAEAVVLSTVNENVTGNGGTLPQGIIRGAALGSNNGCDVTVKDMEDGKYELIAEFYTNGGDSVTLDACTVSNELTWNPNSGVSGGLTLHLTGGTEIGKVTLNGRCSLACESEGYSVRKEGDSYLFTKSA